MSWRIPRTTFGLAAAVSVVLGALAVFAGWAGQHFAHEELERQLDHRIGAESSVLVGEYARAGLPALTTAVDARHERHAGLGLGYLLVDSTGRRLAGSLIAEAPAQPGWREFLKVDRTGNGDEAHYQALTTVFPTGERLVVAADRMPIDKIDGVIGWLTLGSTLAMLLLGLSGAWILSLITRRRIDAISSVANAITDGDATRRISLDGRAGEFERLSQSLNRMLDRNAELMANLQQVTTDIAHDLLTPLSRQQHQLEFALAEARTPDQFREAIEHAVASAAEIQQLFTALLKISEIESLTLRREFKAVSLSEIAEKVGEAYRPDIEQGGRALIVELEPQIDVVGERHLLSQLLVNLIENAMRHTPSDTTIRMSLCRSADRVVLAVRDDGRGIPATERARVFDRFVRLEPSRSTDGHGLGLSLAKAIATAHDAALELHDASPGLEIRVVFSAMA